MINFRCRPLGLAVLALACQAVAQDASVSSQEIERLGRQARSLPPFKCIVVEGVEAGAANSDTKDTTSWGVHSGTRKYSFAYQDGKYRTDVDTPGQDRDYVNRETKIVKGDRLIQMYTPVYRGRPQMGQAQFGRLRGLTINPLSFSNQVESLWLDEFFKKVHDLKKRTNPDGTFSISGTNDVDAPFEATFSPQKGNVMTSIRLVNPDGNLIIERKVQDFEEVGKALVPTRMSQRILRKDGGKEVEDKVFTLHLTNIVSGPLPKETFEPKYEDRSIVKDGETNVVYVALGNKLYVHPGYKRPSNLLYQSLGWAFLASAFGLVVLALRRRLGPRPKLV